MLKISQNIYIFFYDGFCEREIREFFGKIQEYIHFSNMESSNLFI